MKITTTRAALLPALAACAEVTEKNANHHEFASAVLSAADGRLHVRATNGYQSYSTTVGAVTVAVAGDVMVKAADLYSRVSAIPDGDITLALDGNSLVMRHKARGTRFTVPTYDVTTIRARTTPPETGSTIDGAVLAKLMFRVAPMALQDAAGEQSDMIHSVCLRSNGAGRLWSMAMSRQAGARASVAFDGTINATVPLPAARHLAKILGRYEGPVSVAVQGTALHVWCDAFSYSTQLSGREFPEFLTVVLDRSLPVSYSVDREALGEALKVVRAVGPVHGRVRFRALDGQVLLRAASMTGDTGEQAVDVDGKVVTVSYTAAHLVDALAFFDQHERVSFFQQAFQRQAGNGDVAPLILRADDSGDGFMALPSIPDHEDVADEIAVTATAEAA